MSDKKTPEMREKERPMGNDARRRPKGVMDHRRNGQSRGLPPPCEMHLSKPAPSESNSERNPDDQSKGQCSLM